jgi:hypothetical protein
LSLFVQPASTHHFCFFNCTHELEEGTAPRTDPSLGARMPDVRGADPSSDFHFVERDDPEKVAATLVKLVQEWIPERFRLDPIRDVEVLLPDEPGIGVHELNTALQKVLNPARPGQPAVERFGWRFQIADKVIQTENDYDRATRTCSTGTWGSSSELMPSSSRL